MEHNAPAFKLLFNTPPWRPATITFAEAPEFFSAGSVYKNVFQGIRKGKFYCFRGTYGTAMAFYSWLKKQIYLKYPVHNYSSSRQNKEMLQKYAGHLILHIHNHSADLAGAPQNSWLKILYPDENDFYIRFSDFLGLNGAWQWFQQGIQYPGLKDPVHPFYGTYFPTRTEHLSLFDQWLSKQKGFEHALDMGTGCGVLSRYMLQHRIHNITATDININSLYSLHLDLERYGNASKIQFVHTSFFEGLDVSAFDLIVFNPPWIPEKTSGLLDKAMYYDPSFFDAFFGKAYEGMKKEAILLIIFSTFAEAAEIPGNHPISKELKSERFELIEKIQTSVLQTPSKRKDWLSEIRSNEKIELWVLKKR
ncbi:MAG: class I SAM-dependent methyltransferase [Bacteroidales bacterium]|nr:class I SAM-dependent methyltransferase [Bacteroidales bacterium]